MSDQPQPNPADTDSARSGNDTSREVYAKIVQEQYSAVLRAAQRLCPGEEDRACDLVQDSFVRGYEAFLDGRFQAGSFARQWLVRILTNTFINEYNRKRKWEAPVTVDMLTDESAPYPVELRDSPKDRPDSLLLAGVLDETVERALAMLSPDLRSAIALVDIEGFDYDDAARTLGINSGTLRTRLSRARMRLHDQLMEYVKQRGRP